MPHGDIHGHMHLRQRAHRSNSVHYAYPSSNRFIRGLDRFIYIVGVAGPLVSIPQLITIYGGKSAEGISILTWSGYAILSSIWLVYGVVHREKPIIVTQILWLCVNTLIVIGALLYS